MINILGREDEEIFRVAYQMRIFDNDKDYYTNFFFGELINNNLDSLIVKLILLNTRDGNKLKWKNETIYLSLKTGKDFKYQLKHDETEGTDNLFLIGDKEPLH